MRVRRAGALNGKEGDLVEFQRRHLVITSLTKPAFFMGTKCIIFLVRSVMVAVLAFLRGKSMLVPNPARGKIRYKTKSKPSKRRCDGKRRTGAGGKGKVRCIQN